jgi:hypothetical protein
LLCLAAAAVTTLGTFISKIEVEIFEYLNNKRPTRRGNDESKQFDSSLKQVGLHGPNA